MAIFRKVQHLEVMLIFGVIYYIIKVFHEFHIEVQKDSANTYEMRRVRCCR